jgi:hypothetical protein
MVIALMCGIAALTITVAIVTNRLPDSHAWMAAVFFTAVGGAAWIAGRAAKQVYEAIRRPVELGLKAK